MQGIAEDMCTPENTLHFKENILAEEFDERNLFTDSENRGSETESCFSGFDSDNESLMTSYSNHDQAHAERNITDEMEPRNCLEKHYVSHIGSKHSYVYNAESSNSQGVGIGKPDICGNQIEKQQNKKLKRKIIIICHSNGEQRSKYSKIVRNSTLSIHNKNYGLQGDVNNKGVEYLRICTSTMPECGNEVGCQKSSSDDIQVIKRNMGCVAGPHSAYDEPQIIDHKNCTIGYAGCVASSHANRQSFVPSFNHPGIYSQPGVAKSIQNATSDLNGNASRLQASTVNQTVSNHLTLNTREFCSTFSPTVSKCDVNNRAYRVIQDVTNEGNGCFRVRTTAGAGNEGATYKYDDFITWEDDNYIFIPFVSPVTISPTVMETNGEYFQSIEESNDGNTNHNLTSNEQEKEKMEKSTDDFGIQKPCSSFSSPNNNIHRKALSPQFVGSSQPAPNHMNSTPEQIKNVVTEGKVKKKKPKYSQKENYHVLKDHSYFANPEGSLGRNFSDNVDKLSAKNEDCEVLHNSADALTENVSADRSPKDEINNSESETSGRSIKDKLCATTPPLLQNIPNFIFSVEDICAMEQTKQSLSSRDVSVNVENIVEPKQRSESTTSFPDSSISERERCIPSLEDLVKRISKEVTVKLISEKISDNSGTDLLKSTVYGNEDVQTFQTPSQEIIKKVTIKPKEPHQKKQVIAAPDGSNEEYSSKMTSLPTSVVNVDSGPMTSGPQKRKAVPTQETNHNYCKQTVTSPKVIKVSDNCLLIPERNVAISKVQTLEKDPCNNATSDPKSVYDGGNFGNILSNILTSKNSKEISNSKDFSQDSTLNYESKSVEIMDNYTGTHRKRPVLICHRRKVKRTNKDNYECNIRANLKENCIENTTNNNNCNINPNSNKSYYVKDTTVSLIPGELNHEHSSVTSQRPNSVGIIDSDVTSDSHLLYPENNNILSPEELVTNIFEDIPSSSAFIEDKTSYNDCNVCSPLESQYKKLSLTVQNHDTFEETTFKQNLVKTYSRKSKVSGTLKRQNRRGKSFPDKLGKNISIKTGTVMKSVKDVRNLSMDSRRRAKCLVDAFPNICSDKVVKEDGKCSPGEHLEKDVIRKARQPLDPVTESKSSRFSESARKRKKCKSNLSVARSALAGTDSKKSNAVNELQSNHRNIGSHYSNLDSLLINDRIDSLSTNDSTLLNENNHNSTKSCKDNDTDSELNKAKKDGQQHKVNKILEVIDLSVDDGNCFCKNKMQISAKDQNGSCAVCCAKEMNCKTLVSRSDAETILYPFDRNMLFNTLGLVEKSSFDAKQCIPSLIAHRTRNVRAIKIMEKQKEREYKMVNQPKIPYSDDINDAKSAKISLLKEQCLDDAEVKVSPKDSFLKILSFEKNKYRTASISDVDESIGKKLPKNGVCELSFEGFKDGNGQERENSPNLTAYIASKGNENMSLVSSSMYESDSVDCSDNAENCNESSRCKDTKDNMNNNHSVHELQIVIERLKTDAGDSLKCVCLEKKRERSVFGESYKQCKIHLSPRKQIDGNKTPILHSKCQKSSKDTDQQKDDNASDCLQLKASVSNSVPEYVASVLGQSSSHHAEYKNCIEIKKRRLKKPLRKKFKNNVIDKRTPSDINIDKTSQIVKSNNTLHDNNMFPGLLRCDKLDLCDSQSSFDVRSHENTKKLGNHVGNESKQHKNVKCYLRTKKKNKSLVQQNWAQSDISSMENNGQDQLECMSSAKINQQNLVQSVSSGGINRQEPVSFVEEKATFVENIQDPKLCVDSIEENVQKFAKSSIPDKISRQDIVQSHVSSKYEDREQTILQTSLSAKENGHDTVLYNTSKEIGQGLLMFIKSAEDNGKTPVLCGSLADNFEKDSEYAICKKVNRQDVVQPNLLVEDNVHDSVVSVPSTELNREESVQYATSTENIEHDLVQSKASAENKRQAFIEHKRRASAASKEQASAASEEWASAASKRRASAASEERASAPSKRRASAPSKGRASTASKGRASLASKRWASAASKGRASAASKGRASLASKTWASAASKRQATTASKGRAFAPSKGLASAESKGWGSAESIGCTSAESKGQASTENKEHDSAKSKGQAAEKSMEKSLTESKGQASFKSKGQDSAENKEETPTKSKGQTPTKNQEETPTKSKKETPTKSKGQTPTKNQEETPTKSKKETPTKSKGETPTKSKEETPTKSKEETPTKSKEETPTKSKGETPTKSKGETPTKSKGETPTKSKGKTHSNSKRKTPTKSKGETHSKSNGKASAESKGQASAESKGQASAESKGQASAESKGQASAESKGQASAESKGQASAESKGQASAESKEQASAESKRQASAESKGQASAESKGQASAESKGQACAESKGQACAESKGQACAESKGQASAESKRQASAESKEQASAESKEQASAESKVQASAESKVQASAENKRQASAESKGQTSAESKGQALAESKGQASAESKRQASAESKRQASAESKGQASTESKRQASAESKGQASVESKREASAESKRQASAESKRQASAESKGQASAESKGQASAESKRQASAESKKQASAESKKQASAESKKQASAESKGQASAESKGQASAESKRQASAESKGQASAESKRQASAESKRQASAESKGQASAESKRQASAESKGQASAESKGQASAENKRQASAESKGQASAESKRQASAESKRQASAESKGQDSAESKRQASAESKRQASAESKRQASAESKRQASAESKRQASAESKRQASAESKGQASAESKGQASAESKGQASAESKGQASAESKRQVSVESKIQVSAESKGKASAEIKGQASAEIKGQASAEIKGQDSAESKRQASAESKGQASAESKGQASAESKRQASAESKRQASAESKGQDSAESKGQASADNKGQASADNKGQASADNKGQDSAESKGQAFADNKGQASADNKGQASAESKGQAFADNKGQASAENKGQASAESKGQDSAESKGQDSAESKGQTSAESKGQASADNKGQASAENKGQNSAESKENASRKCKKKASAESRGQTPTKSKGELSAERKERASAESKGLTSAKCKGQATEESKGTDATENNINALTASLGQASTERKSKTSTKIKRWTSAESKGRASAESKGRASAESKGHNIAESKGHTSAESKGQASAESKRQVSAESKRQVSAESRRQVSAESKRQVSAESKRQVSVESKRQVSAESKGKASAELKGQASAEIKGQASAEIKGQVSAESKRQASAESKRQASAESKGKASAESKGQASAEIKGQVSAESKRQASAESKRQASAESKGKASAESKGKASAESKGKASAESNGKASTESKGKASAESKGKASAESKGKASAESKGKASAESKGKASAESKGKASAESKGKASAESKGKASAESKGKASAESKGKASAESKGKDSAESKGKDSAESKGKASAESKGKAFAGSKGKASAESKGKASAESKGKASAESNGKASAESKGKASAESKVQTSAESNGQPSAESKVQASTSLNDGNKNSALFSTSFNDSFDCHKKTSERGIVKFFYRSSGLPFSSNKKSEKMTGKCQYIQTEKLEHNDFLGFDNANKDHELGENLMSCKDSNNEIDTFSSIPDESNTYSLNLDELDIIDADVIDPTYQCAVSFMEGQTYSESSCLPLLLPSAEISAFSGDVGINGSTEDLLSTDLPSPEMRTLRNITGRARGSTRQETPDKILRSSIKKPDTHMKISSEIQTSDDVVDQINAAQKENCPDKTVTMQKVQRDIFKTTEPRPYLPLASQKRKGRIYNRRFKYNVIMKNGKRWYPCDLCGHKFGSSGDLVRHTRMHNGERPFKCDICFRTFKQKGALNKHLLLHEGKRPYLCTTCNVTFTQKAHLKSHQRVHTGEKPFRCEECGKSFSRLDHLKGHANTHTFERPFKCDLCTLTFKGYANLAKHKKIHLDVRRHQCTYCDASFLVAHSLKLHVRTHTGERPVHCPLCNVDFRFESSLRKHASTFHPDFEVRGSVLVPVPLD
nr:uncharacterized protein LOC123747307 isoform X1 [Procambarus clarkii]XP_045585365.1 uncharacterized protein LOC123747307 isoform X1 [Procambarus clarkii]